MNTIHCLPLFLKIWGFGSMPTLNFKKINEKRAETSGIFKRCLILFRVIIRVKIKKI
jgi:hypothetical protein